MENITHIETLLDLDSADEFPLAIERNIRCLYFQIMVEVEAFQISKNHYVISNNNLITLSQPV